jgi:hypothetical protein
MMVCISQSKRLSEFEADYSRCTVAISQDMPWVPYLLPGFQSHLKFPLVLICHNLSFGATNDFLRSQEIPQKFSRVEWLIEINE